VKSFKQYLEMIDPERYEKFVSNESLSTKRWKEEIQESPTGWDSFVSNPEATEQYIDWVSRGKF